MPYTGCPTDMLSSSDPILQILKPHMSKSKTCFEQIVKNSFRLDLEIWKKSSIFKLNIKKVSNSKKKMPGGGRGGGWNLTHFFLFWIKKYFQFDFPRFQGAIWKIFSQEFQNMSYFLTYVVLKIKKWVGNCQYIGVVYGCVARNQVIPNEY